MNQLKGIKRPKAQIGAFKAKGTLGQKVNAAKGAFNVGTVASGGGARGGLAGAPAPTGQPWDAKYETQVGSLRNTNAGTLANIQNQENTARSQYGFDDQYANDPYTRANLLKQSWNTNRLKATNAMASRGQLYSGATSNALGYADEGYNRDYNTAQQGYQDLLNRFSTQRLQANQGMNEGIAAAEAQRIQDTMDAANQLDTSTIPLPPEAPQSLGSKVNKAKKKKGKK